MLFRSVVLASGTNNVCDPAKQPSNICTKSGTHKIDADLSALGGGRYKAWAESIDLAGNVGRSKQVDLLVDRDTPSAPVFIPKRRDWGLRVAGKKVILYWPKGKDDLSGVARYEVRVSTRQRPSVLWDRVKNPEAAVDMSNKLKDAEITTLRDTDVRAEVRTVDRAGNVSSITRPDARKTLGKKHRAPRRAVGRKPFKDLTHPIEYGLSEPNPNQTIVDQPDTSDSLKTFNRYLAAFPNPRKVSWLRLVVPFDQLHPANGKSSRDANPDAWARLDKFVTLIEKRGFKGIISFMGHSFADCTLRSVDPNTKLKPITSFSPNTPGQTCSYPANRSVYASYFKEWLDWNASHGNPVKAWAPWNEPDLPGFTLQIGRAHV